MAKKIIDTRDKKSAKNYNLQTWLIVGVIVLAIVGAFITWIFLQHKQTQTANEKTEMTASNVVDNVLNGNETPNESTLKEALHKNPTTGERQQILQLLADEAQRRGDYKAATSYLVQAHEAGVTVALLVQNIASLYLEKLGDKPNALKYFKKARQLSEEQKAEDPYVQQNIQYIEAKIKELETQGVTPAP